MAAKDYEITVGWTGTPYFAKVLKKSKTMSADRRVIEDSEVLGLFENYLRKWTETNPGETLVVTANGKKVFEAKLLDKEL